MPFLSEELVDKMVFNPQLTPTYAMTQHRQKESVETACFPGRRLR